MKYFVAGRKKESIFSKRKNRLILLGIGFVVIAVPSLIYFDIKEAIIQIVPTLVIFAIFDFFMSKMPAKEFVISLEFTDTEINVGNHYEKNNQTIPISEIRSIARSANEITIHSMNDKTILVPLTNFSYNDIQSIKAEIENITTKLESTENPAYV
ncbi:MAG: hypothetical protein R2863_10040 [Candidatus Kapaibacterium sp.]